MKIEKTFYNADFRSRTSAPNGWTGVLKSKLTRNLWNQPNIFSALYCLYWIL